MKVYIEWGFQNRKKRKAHVSNQSNTAAGTFHGSSFEKVRSSKGKRNKFTKSVFWKKTKPSPRQKNFQMESKAG